MRRKVRRDLILAAATILAFCQSIFADQITKEFQSSFTTSDKTAVTSSNIMKMINNFIGKDYQDLEFIVTSCRAGEFGTRADSLGGLFGTWSVDTGSDIKSPTTWSNPSGTKVGWPPSYISAVAADKNTTGAKTLFDTGKTNSAFPGDNPTYTSSGDTADKFTIHGGKSADYALIFNTSDLPKGFRNLQVLKLYDALIADGYTDDAKNDTIEYLSANNAGNVDTTARYQDLVKSMQKLGTQMKSGTPAENKGYIFIQAHGGYDERTVSYLDGQLGQPNGGSVVSNQKSTVGIFADDPIVVSGLKEEVPKSGGGFWADDPAIVRTQLPYLLFSTQQESFFGSTDVNVLLDGFLIGDVMMGNSQGADYQLAIPDIVLNSIFPSIDPSGMLNVQFQFGSNSDSIKLAVAEDYLSSNYTHQDYGITLGYAIDTVDAPEPAMRVPFLAAAALMLAAAIRHKG